MKYIECVVCTEDCGKEYPATHEEPGFCEGDGENYVDLNGSWCCSQNCLDKSNALIACG
jgi:hypothetical protein